MLLSGLALNDAAKIKNIAISDKNAVKRLSDLGVFAGAEIILEGGSAKRKFFVISAGGKTVGISSDVANSITVEKLSSGTKNLSSADGQNFQNKSEQILHPETQLNIGGGV